MLILIKSFLYFQKAYHLFRKNDYSSNPNTNQNFDNDVTEQVKCCFKGKGNFMSSCDRGSFQIFVASDSSLVGYMQCRQSWMVESESELSICQMPEILL